MEYSTIDELKIEASKYENASSEELVALFKDAHIYFPDFVNRFIMLNSIKKYILDDDRIKTYTDEFAYKLKSYSFFSIYLLEKVTSNYSLEVKACEYKNLFMRFYLKNENKFKKGDSFDSNLKALENKKAAKEESFLECVNNFKQLFYTPKGYLDGLNLSIIKEAITKTYGLGEIVELGKIYSINIPKRLNKAELISLIQARLKLSDEERTQIEGKAVTDICSYSKQKGFRISPDLKKADMVEYLIFQLGKYYEDTEKDLYNYDILVSEDFAKTTFEEETLDQSNESIPTSSAYVEAPKEEDMVIPVVEEPKVVEEIKEEETKVEEVKVVEEPKVVEEIKEEPKEETRTVEDVIQSKVEAVNDEEIVSPEIYYDEQVDQEIREIIQNYYDKKTKTGKAFRTTVIILLVLILGVGVLLFLKFYGIF